jgi:YVTN family beta-propeller protein
MTRKFADWRDYQERVAAFFRRNGCNAVVEAKVQGARAPHAVDVFVTFSRHGVQCKWIIECKLWNTAVSKEKVLVLKNVVEDVGADRGILFSESGFQNGALAAASRTNITLQRGLDDFEKTAVIQTTGISLVEQRDSTNEAPAVFAFPTGNQPQTLTLYRGKLYVGNWGSGNIAVVDPNSKSIDAFIELDRYEVKGSRSGETEVRQYQPGTMTIANGKLFLGQVFSDHILAIDTATLSIVKRIAVPGAGQGAIAASPDGRCVYFASNRERKFFVIDTATYSVSAHDFPDGGRGSLCVLSHPTKPLLYIGIQRGGRLNGRSYPYANSFLATYDLERGAYSGYLNLAELINGRCDDAIPFHLLFDERERVLYVGMFQSRMGIYKVNEAGTAIIANLPFSPNGRSPHFQWVDPLAQSLYGNQLLSVNRNNQELVVIDADTFAVEKTIYLGDAPNGPRDLVINGDQAIVSYPERGGLVFLDLIDN